jgi:hypothetical protein
LWKVEDAELYDWLKVKNKISEIYRTLEDEIPELGHETRRKHQKQESRLLDELAPLQQGKEIWEQEHRMLKSFDDFPEKERYYDVKRKIRENKADCDEKKKILRRILDDWEPLTDLVEKQVEAKIRKLKAMQKTRPVSMRLLSIPRRSPFSQTKSYLPPPPWAPKKRKK